jgi:hypothetical protein
MHWHLERSGASKFWEGSDRAGLGTWGADRAGMGTVSRFMGVKEGREGSQWSCFTV